MTAEERRGAVLAYINDFWQRYHYSPSMAEIADACRIPSTSVVRYTLAQLRKAGRLSYRDNVARSIVPAWVDRRLEREDA